MASYEAYQIQRASDGKTLKNNGNISQMASPTLTTSWANVTNSTMGQFYAIPVNYSSNFKQDYSIISNAIDSLPANGEIYRINPIFINLDSI
jgi:hypothetical protein